MNRQIYSHVCARAVTVTHSCKLQLAMALPLLQVQLIARATKCNIKTTDSLLQIHQLRWPLALTSTLSLLHYLVQPPDPVFFASLLFPFVYPIFVYHPSLRSLILTSFLPYSMFASSFTICCCLKGCSNWPALMVLTRSYSQSAANHAKHLPREGFKFWR